MEVEYIEKLKEFARAFGKAYKAFKMYPEGHEVPKIFLRELWEKTRELFKWKPELNLVIDEKRLLDTSGSIVYEEGEKADNIAWTMYRGGLRGIIVKPTITHIELKKFMEAISQQDILDNDRYALIPLIGSKNLESFRFELAEEYIKDEDFNVPDTFEEVMEKKEIEPTGEPIEEEEKDSLSQTEIPIVLQAREIVNITEDEEKQMKSEIEKERSVDTVAKAITYLLTILNFEDDIESYSKMLVSIEEYIYLMLSKGNFKRAIEILKLLRVYAEQFKVENRDKYNHLMEIFKRLGSNETITYMFNPDLQAKPPQIRELISFMLPNAISLMMSKIKTIKESNVKNAVMDGIAHIDGIKPQHIENFLKLPLQPQYKDQIIAAITVMGKLKNRESIGQISTFKESEDLDIKKAVLISLVNTEFEEAMKSATDFFYDDDENIRLLAYQLFIKNSPERLKKIILDKLRDKELDDYIFVEKEMLFSSAINLNDDEINEELKAIISRKRNIFQKIFGDKKLFETEKLLVMTLANTKNTESDKILIAGLSHGNRKIKKMCEEVMNSKENKENLKNE